MVRRRNNDHSQPAATHDKPCCKELLLAAVDGCYANEQGLERVLDHLERTA